MDPTPVPLVFVKEAFDVCARHKVTAVTGWTFEHFHGRIPCDAEMRRRQWQWG
jgi:hypothetical protein